jgi:hypothetical protein
MSETEFTERLTQLAGNGHRFVNLVTERAN